MCQICGESQCVCRRRLNMWWGLRPDGTGARLSHKEFMSYMIARGRYVWAESADTHEFKDGTKFARSIDAATQRNWAELVAQMVKHRVWEYTGNQGEGTVAVR